MEFYAKGWDDVFELEAHFVREFDFVNHMKLNLEPLESPEGFMIGAYLDGEFRYKQWVPNPKAKSPLGFDGKTCLCDGDGFYVLKTEMPQAQVNVFLIGKDIE